MRNLNQQMKKPEVETFDQFCQYNIGLHVERKVWSPIWWPITRIVDITCQASTF